MSTQAVMVAAADVVVDVVDVADVVVTNHIHMF